MTADGGGIMSFPLMQVADNCLAALPITPGMASGDVFSVPRDADGYPPRLLRGPRPPAVLWVKGRVASAARERRSVAIVGSRAASGDGRSRARALAAGLGARGFDVVSGGALGIDAAAHEGALDAGAATFAVLGCGVDVVYPDRHVALFERIVAAGGGLLSEHEPGTPPRPKQFPSRNRIIVGLADVVVVVEANRRSGALITARLAHQHGVPLCVCPGSPGTEDLLAAGWACDVEGVADVEAVLAGTRRPGRAASVVPDGRFAALLRVLGEAPAGPAELTERLGLGLPAVIALLCEAELDGVVARLPGGRYEVRLGS